MSDARAARADLLALTPEAVASLANLGLVKRAQREIGEGAGPALDEDADGLVTGTFADGTVTRLPPGVALRDAPCSCGAATICRHRVAVVLAYAAWRASAAGAAAPAEAAPPWSPGEITDAELERALGKRVLARARALARGGIVVELSPAARADDAPSAKLPTCSVRFLVPRDLAYARCDCAQTTACEHVAVSVWAFREASLRGPLQGTLAVELGRAAGDARVSRRVAEATDARPADPLAPALDLAKSVLSIGVIHLDEAVAPRFALARGALERAGLTWPATLLDDLEDSLAAYRSRSARYRTAQVADVLCQLEARRRASERPAQLPRAAVLGSEIAKETLLDHLRLVSLGARTHADDLERRAEVFLADSDSGVVLVLRRAWSYGDVETPDEGADLARRNVAPRLSLGAVARGQLVSRAVKRRANLEMVVGTSRGGQTSLTPQTGDWGRLPRAVSCASYAELEAELRARPPRLLRARVLADSVRVVPVARVAGIVYAPGEQAVVVDLRDHDDRSLSMVRRHHRAGPHAVDAVAVAAGSGRLRFVAGEVRMVGGGLVIDPIGLVTDSVIVPDLEGPQPEWQARSGTLAEPTTPAHDAVRAGLGALEEACHVGLARVPHGFRDRVEAAAARLDAVGLAGNARRLRKVGEDVTAGRDATGAWLSAGVRLALTEERV
jgi:hypothetical protein